MKRAGIDLFEAQQHHAGVQHGGCIIGTHNARLRHNAKLNDGIIQHPANTSTKQRARWKRDDPRHERPEKQIPAPTPQPKGCHTNCSHCPNLTMNGTQRHTKRRRRHDHHRGRKRRCPTPVDTLCDVISSSHMHVPHVVDLRHVNADCLHHLAPERQCTERDQHARAQQNRQLLLKHTALHT